MREETDTPRLHSSLRRLAVLAAAGGAGFGLTLGALLFAYLWWQGRPTPWNKEAVTAIFQQADFSEDGNQLLLLYTLENRTGRDYTLVSATLTGRLREQGSLFPPLREVLELDTPLFIPARDKVSVDVRMKNPYKGDRPLPPATERDARRTAVLEYVKAHMANLHSLLIIDQLARYEIELPLPTE